MRERAIDWEAWSLRLTFLVLTGVAVVFLVAPSLIVILTSFTASASLKFPPDSYSLRWYAALINADQMQRAAWTSLVVASWTTLIATVLGVMAALAIAGNNALWARLCDLLFMSPLLLPSLA